MLGTSASVREKVAVIPPSVPPDSNGNRNGNGVGGGSTTPSPTFIRRATIEDLYNEEGKAEIINGRIVRYDMTGKKPKYAADEILLSLLLHARQNGLPGRGVGDGGGFRCSLPNRESFSPDVAYTEEPMDDMRFSNEVPRFAAEVRSENDYGLAQEIAMRDKRADYFATGTIAVWDVDLLNEPIVRLYIEDADMPIATFTRGEFANAGDAVPGWEMAVDELFPRTTDAAKQ